MSVHRFTTQKVGDVKQVRVLLFFKCEENSFDCGLYKDNLTRLYPFWYIIKVKLMISNLSRKK